MKNKTEIVYVLAFVALVAFLVFVLVQQNKSFVKACESKNGTAVFNGKFMECVK